MRNSYTPPVVKEDGGDVEWFESSAVAMCHEQCFGDCEWRPDRSIKGVAAHKAAARLHCLETGHNTKVEMQAARIIDFALEG